MSDAFDRVRDFDSLADVLLDLAAPLETVWSRIPPAFRIGDDIDDGWAWAQEPTPGEKFDKNKIAVLGSLKKSVDSLSTTSGLPNDLRRSARDLLETIAGFLHRRSPDPNSAAALADEVRDLAGRVKFVGATANLWRGPDTPSLSSLHSTGGVSISPSAVKPKPVREKVESIFVAGLTAHHHYENGSCLRLEPLGVKAGASQFGVSAGSMTKYFQVHFGSHKEYCRCCQDPRRLGDKLARLNDEQIQRPLYNQLHDEGYGTLSVAQGT